MSTLQLLASWLAFCLVLAAGVGWWAWKRQQKRRDELVGTKGGGGLPAEPPPKK